MKVPTDNPYLKSIVLKKVHNHFNLDINQLLVNSDYKYT